MFNVREPCMLLQASGSVFWHSVTPDYCTYFCRNLSCSGSCVCPAEHDDRTKRGKQGSVNIELFIVNDVYIRCLPSA